MVEGGWVSIFYTNSGYNIKEQAKKAYKGNVLLGKARTL
jgi:hypothetical protein